MSSRVAAEAALVVVRLIFRFIAKVVHPVLEWIGDHIANTVADLARRPYNYDEPPGADGTADCGLIFAPYQRDVGGQFLPIQRNLAEADLLNEWVTPIGSAVFAVPPGCEPGGWVGRTLLG